MFIYFITFIIALACVYLALEIVILTKKTLDRSYKFVTLAAIVFAIIVLAKMLSELGYLDSSKNFNYLYLVFIILFFDSLIFMKRLIKNIEEKKVKKAQS